ncbi:nucleotidylyl transferase [Babesia gibsoni]|uniref:leucine--tRNA ligase n=1 Tax=Babesia gibsoni TaxID=33632 RepID=A0AAD8LQ67_BABGI|nr:nucleotidylyl transferase [Babesia gibsoni]
MPSVLAAASIKRFYAKVAFSLLLLVFICQVYLASSWKAKEEIGRFTGKYSRLLCALGNGVEHRKGRYERTPSTIRQLETRWQQYWEENGVFRAPASHDSGDNTAGNAASVQTEERRCEENARNGSTESKPKFYGLCMIPYPSGDGLHVGHLLGYTVLDVICRYKRMCGYQVLNPIGWDSFGLPAERYAERCNKDVFKVTQDNISNFKRQLKSMGFSYDWSREIATSDPSYYRWTQWIFQQLYKHGVAYRAKETVNWCPELNSVLANEEVKQGRSERGGFDVYRKEMEHWLLRITQYAKRLSEDLDTLDWPASIIDAQKKWIGLEEGFKVAFKYHGDHTGKELYGFEKDIENLHDVDYIEVSSDFDSLHGCVDPAEMERVQLLVKETKRMSNLERFDNVKRVYTGRCVVNPINGNLIKVYVTNAPMLLSKPINCRIVRKSISQNNSDPASTYISQIDRDKALEEAEKSKRISSTVDKDGINMCYKGDKLNTDVVQPFVNVKLKDWVFSRQRKWGEPIPLKYDGTGILPVEESALPIKVGEGNTETMPQWAGSSWHFLRFCDPQNENEPFDKREAEFWMPVDVYVGGAEHAVSHLLYARFWNKFLYDLGLSPVKEPFDKIILHGMIRNASFSLDGEPIDETLVTKYKGKYVLKSDMNTLVQVKLEKMSKSKGNVVSPDAIVEKYGADALRMHLLFLGPICKDKVWSDNGLTGISKMLSRIDRFFRNVRIMDVDQPIDDRLEMLVRKITKDIECNVLNVAISDFFTYLPFMERLPISGILGRNVANIFLRLLSPFAPHIAEDLWHLVNPNYCKSVSSAEWPSLT